MLMYKELEKLKDINVVKMEYKDLNLGWLLLDMESLDIHPSNILIQNDVFGRVIVVLKKTENK